jgi:hypothetical protein
MKLRLTKEDVEHSNGLKISVAGFAGESGSFDQTQVFIEFHEGKLLVHVWDGTSEDPVAIHTIKEREAAREIAVLYDKIYAMTRRGWHEIGQPWTDPRTGITYQPPKNS